MVLNTTCNTKLYRFTGGRKPLEIYYVHWFSSCFCYNCRIFINRFNGKFAVLGDYMLQQLLQAYHLLSYSVTSIHLAKLWVIVRQRKTDFFAAITLASITCFGFVTNSLLALSGLVLFMFVPRGWRAMIATDL